MPSITSTKMSDEQLAQLVDYLQLMVGDAQRARQWLNAHHRAFKESPAERILHGGIEEVLIYLKYFVKKSL